MTDFDTGIEGYANPTTTVTNETGDAFLSLSVSNMTVQDIKNYIDFLASSAGYLTEDEIEAKINEIAKAAGMMSVEEISNLVLTTISDAGALTAGSAEQLINEKVAQAILDLNDNADLINDVKNELIIQIDRLRTELRAIQRDGNSTYSELQVLKNDYQYKIQNFEQSINLIESLLNSIVESKEVYNLLEVERTTRNTEISNIKSIVADKESQLKLKDAELSSKINSVELSVALDKTNLENQMQTLNSELITRIGIIEANLRDSNVALNALLMSGDDLVNKLQAINSVDLNEAGNAVVEVQEKIDEIQNEFTEVSSLVTTKVSEIETIVSEFNDLKLELDQKITANATEIAVATRNLDGKIDIETEERKLQFNNVLNSWGEYTTTINKEVTSLATTLNDLNSKINEFPSVLDEMIKIENEARVRGDVSLDSRITREIGLLRNEFDTSDLEVKIEEVRQKLNAAITKYDNAIVQEIKLMFDSINGEVVRLDGKIDLTESINSGKIQVEEAARIQADANLDAKIDLESSTRQTRIEEIKTQFNELNARFESILSNIAVGDPIPLQTLIDNLNNRYLDLFNQVDNISDKEAQDYAQLSASLAAIETTIAQIESVAIENINAEADARVAGDNGLQNTINVIMTKLDNFFGLVDEDKRSLDKIYQSIADVQYNLDQFEINFDDNLRVELASVKGSITNLETLINNTKADLTAEKTARIAGDLELNTKIDVVDAKLDPMKNTLISEINTVAGNANAGIQTLDAKIDAEIQNRIAGDATRQVEFDQLETTVDSRLDAADALIQQEIDNRIIGDQGLNEALTQEISTRTSEISTLTSSLANETQARTAADAELRNALDAQAATIQSILSTDSEVNLENLRAVMEMIKYITENPDANATTELLQGLNEIEDNLAALIQTEADARIAGDDQNLQELQQAVTAAQNALDDAVANLQTAIDGVQSNLDTSVGTITDSIKAMDLKIDQEIINRNDGDTQLQLKIEAEELRAETEEARIVTLIEDEEAARTLADDNLQTQINSHLSGMLDTNNRVATLELKESQLMANLPSNVQSLVDILDIINGNYQNITTRIDSEVQSITTRLDDQQSSLQAETAARLLADSNLTNLISSTKSDLESADRTLQNNIDSEEAARIKADNDLQTQITTIVAINTQQSADITANDNAISAEVVARIKNFNKLIAGDEGDPANPYTIQDQAGAFESLSAFLTDYIDSKSRISTLEANLATEEEARSSGDIALDDKIVAEIQNRIDADAALDGRITSEVATLTSAIDGVDTRLSGVETTVNSIMQNADAALDSFAEVKAEITTTKAALESQINGVEADLQTQITNNSTLINTEESARIAGDSNLNTKIDTEIQNRTDADTTLQNNIDIEATARSDADNALQTNISDETTARQSADANLQTQIDALPKAFVDLIDVPNMSGSELYLIRIKSDGTGIEYIDPEELIPEPRLDAKLETTDIVSIAYVIESDIETDKIEKITYVDGTYAIYTYDTNDQVSIIEYYDSADTLLASKSYSYNTNNRLISTSWTDTQIIINFE